MSVFEIIGFWVQGSQTPLDPGGGSSQCLLEIRSILEKLQHKDDYKKLNVIGKWMVILKNANLVEMRKLVGALLTVFASNAYCESSLLGRKENLDIYGIVMNR
ncbi:hypothetical protein AAVH_16540 [Aphelenchoides avenae]|nr:hypothetical protein AAVH_16540 [Aphelenchus avenae]